MDHSQTEILNVNIKVHVKIFIGGILITGIKINELVIAGEVFSNIESNGCTVSHGNIFSFQQRSGVNRDRTIVGKSDNRLHCSSVSNIEFTVRGKIYKGADFQYTFIVDLNNTLFIDGKFSIVALIINGSIVHRTIGNNQFTGIVCLIINGNTSTDHCGYRTVKSDNTIDIQSTGPESVIDSANGFQIIRIAGNIHNTVMGNMHITEISNRILNVQRIPGIGHSCSFVILTTIVFRTNPAAVGA